MVGDPYWYYQPPQPPYSWYVNTPDAMTLRDYFAAACISDVLNHFSWTDEQISAAAAFAYRLADAMLAARSTAAVDEGGK